MRTLVDLPDDDVKVLDAIAADENLPRAELVRRAVALYISEEKKERSNAALDKYFGFLKDSPNAFGGLGGLEYQQQIRGEWDARDEKYSKWALHDSAQGGFEHKPHDGEESQ